MRDPIQELNERKINIIANKDRIRWEYRPPGNFSVKEATSLASGAASLPSEKRWVRLWN